MRARTQDSSDDDDDFQPKRSKQAKEFKHLVSDIQDMRADYDHLFRVNETLQLPIGLHNVIREAFCCCICRSSPMVPPIIYARLFGSVLLYAVSMVLYCHSSAFTVLWLVNFCMVNYYYT